MFSTKLLAAALSLVLIFSSFESGAGDMSSANCRIKVLNMSLKHCLTDGLNRAKRDAIKADSEDRSVVETPPEASASGPKRQIMAGISDPLVSHMVVENAGESRGRGIPNPWDQGYVKDSLNQGFGFQPPASGDDLGMGLSAEDMEDLYNEMIERLPRAAKNKEQTMKMITAYAASCCNEKLGADTCSDLTNVIDCP